MCKGNIFQALRENQLNFESVHVQFSMRLVQKVGHGSSALFLFETKIL